MTLTRVRLVVEVTSSVHGRQHFSRERHTDWVGPSRRINNLFGRFVQKTHSLLHMLHVA